MEGVLVPLALFASIAYAVVGTTRAVADARTRRQLVQSGATVEMVRAVAGDPPDGRAPHPALLWGLVAGAVGLALVLLHFLRFGEDDPIAAGLVLLFGAAGALAAYALAGRLARGTGARALPPGRASGGQGGPPSVPPVAHLELGGPA